MYTTSYKLLDSNKARCAVIRSHRSKLLHQATTNPAAYSVLLHRQGRNHMDPVISLGAKLMKWDVSMLR